MEASVSVKEVLAIIADERELNHDDPMIVSLLTRIANRVELLKPAEEK
jgi:hypothetical protein